MVLLCSTWIDLFAPFFVGRWCMRTLDTIHSHRKLNAGNTQRLQPNCTINSSNSMHVLLCIFHLTTLSTSSVMVPICMSSFTSCCSCGRLETIPGTSTFHLQPFDMGVISGSLRSCMAPSRGDVLREFSSNTILSRPSAFVSHYEWSVCKELRAVPGIGFGDTHHLL